jgi:hypothetical protein
MMSITAATGADPSPAPEVTAPTEAPGILTSLLSKISEIAYTLFALLSDAANWVAQGFSAVKSTAVSSVEYIAQTLGVSPKKAKEDDLPFDYATDSKISTPLPGEGEFIFEKTLEFNEIDSVSQLKERSSPIRTIEVDGETLQFAEQFITDCVRGKAGVQDIFINHTPEVFGGVTNNPNWRTELSWLEAPLRRIHEFAGRDAEKTLLISKLVNQNTPNAIVGDLIKELNARYDALFSPKIECMSWNLQKGALAFEGSEEARELFLHVKVNGRFSNAVFNSPNQPIFNPPEPVCNPGNFEGYLIINLSNDTAKAGYATLLNTSGFPRQAQ